MDVCKWSKANADYGRKLWSSGIEGARSGGEQFLDGQPLAPFVGESVRSALKAAAVGACIGALGSRQRSAAGKVAYSLLGAAIGLGAGVAWESRRLTASVAASALRNIGKVRDERWLINNPIDYA